MMELFFIELELWLILSIYFEGILIYSIFTYCTLQASYSFDF
jgi:hypothetical protein